MPSKTGCLCALTLRTRMPLCTHLAYPEALTANPAHSKLLMSGKIALLVQ